MNKVDKMVAKLMLAYPTLYPDRFKALRYILTTSNYHWDNGCLVEDDYPKPGPERTPEDARASFLKHVEESKGCICPEQYLEDVHNLHWYDFVSEHIEIAASRYFYRTEQYIIMGDMLGRMARGGMDFGRYSPIMHKPEVVDQEWNDAISGWLSQLTPTMNGLWCGNLHQRGPLKPSIGLTRSQLKTWETIYYLKALYHSDLDRKRDKISSDIIDKILAEKEQTK